MKIDAFNEFLTLDFKSIDNRLTKIDCPVEQILTRYKKEIGDYENDELSVAIFNRLGWNTYYKDTIFNFHFIYLTVISIFSKLTGSKCDYECSLSDGKLKYMKKGGCEKNNSYSKKRQLLKKVLRMINFLI